MRLAVFRDMVDVENLQQLHEHLRFRRDDGYACFWLWHNNESQLAVMVHGNNASVHYFPHDNHPGFMPVIACNDSDEVIEFRADNGEQTYVPRGSVTSCSSSTVSTRLFVVSR